ncbi:MAG: hypothetical protein WCI11_07690 [Candidatus Methylumidiphilus sp.]
MSSNFIKTYPEWISKITCLNSSLNDFNFEKPDKYGNLNKDGFNLANCDIHCQFIAEAFDYLLTSTTNCSSKKSYIEIFRNLFTNNTSGSFLEIVTYYWLVKSGLNVIPQISLDNNIVLGKNGSIIDGKVELLIGSAYFDIKSFGFTAKLAGKLCAKLEENFPEFRVLIEGSWDKSTKEFTNLIQKYQFIVDELKKNSIMKIGQTIIRLEKRKAVTVSGRISEPYLLAKENAQFPFKEANQFTMHEPFLLIYVAHPWFGLTELHDDFSGTASTFTRAFSRRCFFQFSNDESRVKKHCHQVKDGMTIKESSRLLSGIIFLSFCLFNQDEINRMPYKAWIYLNPRATNKLTCSDFDLLDRKYSNITIDDFIYDDY